MRRFLFTAALLAAVTISRSAVSARAAEARTGLDVLVETNFQDLRGKRIGLITNPTGKSRDNASDIDILSAAPGVTLSAIFSPEHGLSAAVEEGPISTGAFKLRDGRSIPLYSLYGSTLAPTSGMLAGLDALVFDIQDIGARFYTYAATMGMAMESAAAAHVPFYVLDRPNPITGSIVEGPILSPDIRHLTAYFPIPVRHGLTIGEIAKLHVLLDKINVDLHVIAMKGWERGLWYDETGLPWTPPSPNMPGLDSALLYPGIGCFESTNVSVGRGTPHPFLWIGAPWLDAPALLQRMLKAHLAGVHFSIRSHAPSKSLYAGRKIPGIGIRVTNRARVRPLAIFAHLACALRDLHPKEFEVRWDEIRRMVGTDRFRELYESGAEPKEIIELFNAGAAEFKKSSKFYLLY